MTTPADLLEIRRSAFRDAHQDGLIELAIGLLLFVVALATGRPAFIWTYLVAIFMLGPGLERLKARFTYPRIGYAKLPDESPRAVGRGVLTWVLGGGALFVNELTLTGNLTDNLAWRRGAPALAGVLFAGGLSYLASRSGLIRHYALAIASVAVGFGLVWPEMAEPYENVRVWALIMALVSLATGAWVLRRFVRGTRIVEQRDPDGD